MSTVDTLDLFRAALRLQQAGELQKAEELYRKGLAEQPDRQAYVNLGVMLFDQQRWADALQHYCEGLERLQHVPGFWHRAGHCATFVGDFTKAEHCYRSGLACGVDLSLNYLGLARLAMLCNDEATAQAHANQALAAKGESFAAFVADDEVVTAVDRYQADFWSQRAMTDDVLEGYRRAFDEPHKALVKYLLRHIATERAAESGRFLDFGCATAALAGCLQALDLQERFVYHGCDIHPELLHTARQDYPNLTIVDSTELDDLEQLMRQGFEVVYFGAVLCTINPQALAAILQRILPHTEAVLIVDPMMAVDGQQNLVVNRGENVLPLYAHPWRRILQQSGFTISKALLDVEESLIHEMSGAIYACRS